MLITLDIQLYLFVLTWYSQKSQCDMFTTFVGESVLGYISQLCGPSMRTDSHHFLFLPIFPVQFPKKSMIVISSSSTPWGWWP